MKSRTTRRFRDALAELPAPIRQLARDAYQMFRQNPSHPGLRFKKLIPDPPIYSVRIGIGHRAVGTLNGDTIIWFWIGSHADYDKLLKQL